MPVSVSDLRDEQLFIARNLYTATDYTSQKNYLWQKFQTLTGEGDAEGTIASMDGESSTFQWRGATPEEKRAALRGAIEHLEGLIAGNVASQYAKPFGFKWVNTPHENFDAPGSTAIA